MSNRSVLRRHAILTSCLVCLVCATPTARAQPVMDITRLVVQWPVVEVSFAVRCGGEGMLQVDTTMLQVRENGVPVSGVAVQCAQTSQRNPISTGLVFDVSGSMTGRNMQAAIEAGLRFIEQMDGQVDEATVLTFGNDIRIKQTMTRNRDALRQAIAGLELEWASPIWDGLYAALVELAAKGTSGCRSVLVIGDSEGCCTTRTPAECIDLANRHGIRIAFVDMMPQVSAMHQATADLTGGRLVLCDAGVVPDVVNDLQGWMMRCFDDCTLRYTARVPDGSIRTVEVAVHDTPCGDIARTKTYRAPLVAIDEAPTASWSIDAWPDPVTDRVAVRVAGATSSVHLRIVDLFGRTVVDMGDVHGVDGGIRHAVLSGLPSGVYHLVATSGTARHLRKLLKR